MVTSLLWFAPERHLRSSSLERVRAFLDHELDIVRPLCINEAKSRERTAESKLLEEARDRLRQLEAARCAQKAVVSSPSATPLDSGTQVQSGPVERPRLRQRSFVPLVGENTIPPMPTLVPRELSEWMEDRKMPCRAEITGQLHHRDSGSSI